jgi:hypothetical protein
MTRPAPRANERGRVIDPASRFVGVGRARPAAAQADALTWLAE